MEVTLNDKQYRLVEDFVATISDNNQTKLLNDFDLPPAVHEEIRECLENYFDSTETLTAPPRARQTEITDDERCLVEAFHMNDGNIGIECVIFANNIPSEAILHLELTKNAENPKLIYKYIGS